MARASCSTTATESEMKLIFSKIKLVPIFNNNIVFILKGAVDLTVGLTKIDATKMTDKTVHATNYVTEEVAFNKLCGEGIVYVSLFFVNGYALTMASALISRKNFAWKIHIVLLKVKEFFRTPRGYDRFQDRLCRNR